MGGKIGAQIINSVIVNRRLQEDIFYYFGAMLDLQFPFC